MMKKYNLAIVGATGLVGREFIKIIESRNFPADSIQLLASDRNPGRKILTGRGEMPVHETTPAAFENIDIAIFTAGAEIARYFVPLAMQSGAMVLDTSPAFWTGDSVPLVVPEVNPQDVENHKGIIANPNCSTIQLSVVLHPLNRVNRIKRVVVSTYQSVSGIGSAGTDELTRQTKTVLEGKTPIPHVFPHQIAFNVVPEVDIFMDNGYTREEFRLTDETRRVLHDAEMGISATCVRVPVYIGHCQAVHIELTKPMAPEEARQILASAPGIKILDDPSVSLYPQPWSVAGSDEVFVGRVRQDMNSPTGLVLWTAADNLRKGTAMNAIQILEESIKRGRL